MSRSLELAAILTALTFCGGLITAVAFGLAYVFNTDVSIWLWHGSWWLLIGTQYIYKRGRHWYGRRFNA